MLRPPSHNINILHFWPSINVFKAKHSVNIPIQYLRPICNLGIDYGTISVRYVRGLLRPPSHNINILHFWPSINVFKAKHSVNIPIQYLRPICNLGIDYGTISVRYGIGLQYYQLLMYFDLQEVLGPVVIPATRGAGSDLECWLAAFRHFLPSLSESLLYVFVFLSRLLCFGCMRRIFIAFTWGGLILSVVGFGSFLQSLGGLPLVVILLPPIELQAHTWSGLGS